MRLKFFSIILACVLMAFSVSAVSTVSYVFNTSSTTGVLFLSKDIIRSSSMVFYLSTDVASICKYSKISGLTFEAMENTFDYNFDTLHRQSFTDLTDGVYTYYILCKNGAGAVSPQLTFNFAVSTPVSASISFSSSPPFRSEKVELDLVTTKPLASSPSLSYSFDSVHYTSLPLSGSGKNWNGYLIVPDSIGESVGSFVFQGRDVEGILGEEITEGKLFLVDTISPSMIPSFQTIGRDRSVYLSWHDANNEKNYRIYRTLNPPVDYPDFYVTASGSSFIDTSVERGKTYYYKISAVDEAGNEGPLSIESSATVLLQNASASQSGGLSSVLIGSVDSVLLDLEVLKGISEQIKSSFADRDEKQKQIYQDLKLENDITGVVSELGALERELINYKSQPLTKAELDRKLSAASLKINSFKKRLPETFLVDGETSGVREMSDNALQQVFLELRPDSNEEILDRAVSLSSSFIEKSSFSIKFVAYRVAIIYVDGTRKEITLVKEDVKSSAAAQENFSLFESIPRSLSESASDIDVKTVSYSVAKEDAVLSFPLDTKSIIYVFPRFVDLSLMREIKTVVLYQGEDYAEIPSGTGYAVFSDLISSSKLGVTISLLVLVALGFYIVFLKVSQLRMQRISNISDEVSRAKFLVDAGDVSAAQQVYQNLTQTYTHLSKKEKEKIYPLFKELYSLLCRAS